MVIKYKYHPTYIAASYSLFTFMIISKLGCDDFICNIVYSLMS